MSDMIEAKPIPAVNIRPVLMKRLFSLFGIVPLSVYVIIHLWNNNYSWQGADSFNKHLVESRSWPFYTAAAILFLYIPLVFHSVYGIWIASRGRKTMVTQLPTNPYFQMLKYTLQRLSGIGLFLFIAAHVYKTKVETHMPDYAHMKEGLSENLTYTIYALGILGIAYHLANGLWSAAITWGITVNNRSQRVLEALTIGLFFVIAALGFGAVHGFLQ